MIKEDSMMSPLPEKSEPFAGLQKVNIYIYQYMSGSSRRLLWDHHVLTICAAKIVGMGDLSVLLPTR